MRFRRCAVCEAIATSRRPAVRGDPELACDAHATGDGWDHVCSVEDCERPPMFKIEYRVSERRAKMAACPVHFQILPDDMSEVFRLR